MDRDRFDLQRKIIKDGKNGGQKTDPLVFDDCTCENKNIFIDTQEKVPNEQLGNEKDIKQNQSD